MADRIADADVVRQRLLAQTRPKMIKAHLRKAETDAWRAKVGAAVKTVMHDQQLSLKEFAGAVGRHERQVARWFEGTEHAQLAAIFAVVKFRQPLILALAELAGEQVTIDTTITIRRQA